MPLLIETPPWCVVPPRPLSGGSRHTFYQGTGPARIDDDLITKIRHAPVLGSIPRTNETRRCGIAVSAGSQGLDFSRGRTEAWALGLPYFFR